MRIAGLPAKKSPRLITLDEVRPKKSATKPKPKLHIPPVVTAKNRPIPEPVFTVPVTADPNAPTDLMSYIKSKKQQSQDSGSNAIVPGPSADEIANANLMRNLQQPGTSGIFQIRRLSSDSAQFSFNGWKNGYGYGRSRLEIFDVEADKDGNISLAVVRKMIEIIRRDYKGNFNWDSQRLGRVIVLSARLEDNAGLESFLMQEFFNDSGRYP